ncbi:MAG TPA: FAD-dependent thymidylate synthase [Anaerolineales bacterium]|nr:FAD-dependent thymidylate synthase [Anaerolineales bacterium]
MPTDSRRVYLLSPRRLSPETIAVTFAKTSRSPQSFEEIAEELTDGRSAAFHEKWVVGYGHASVAEHAVLHLAFEGVSRLAIECIESNRLASYTEKSTRYQKWEAEAFHRPAELEGNRLQALYLQTCQSLFAAYLESIEPVRRVVQRLFPRQEGETEARWEGRLRARYVDVCRFTLPAAALANVGMTANARTLEHAIRKMLCHPLEEVRQIGQATKAAAIGEIPTLLKYAEPGGYLAGQRQALAPWRAEAPLQEPDEPVRLLTMLPSSEAAVLATAVYPFGEAPLEKVLDWVRLLSPEQTRSLAEALLGGRDRHDVPPRSLEHAVFTFEVVLDQGAYLELKRHRMMSQTPQRLTTRLGYTVPRLITEAGLEPGYRRSMEAASQAFEALAEWNDEVASYLVPNAFRRRVVLTMNLREAFHFCELRAAPNAHFSMRRIALRMAEVLQQNLPLLGRALRLPEGTTWQEIEREHFTQA